MEFETSNDIHLKKNMFNEIKNSFKLICSNLEKNFLTSTIDKLDFLSCKESNIEGVGIFSDIEYQKSDIVCFDFSKDFYDFRRFNKTFNDKTPSYLDFYNQENYGVTHNLGGENQLFPILGLINHNNDPNCIMVFKTLTQDKKGCMGYLIALKNIKKGEELTSFYLPPYNDILNTFFDKRYDPFLNPNEEHIRYNLRNMKDVYTSITIPDDYLDIFLDFIKLEKDVKLYEEILKNFSKYFVYQIFNIYETLLNHYLIKLNNNDYIKDDKPLYLNKLYKVMELKKLNIFNEFINIYTLYNKIYNIECNPELSNIVTKIVHKIINYYNTI